MKVKTSIIVFFSFFLLPVFAGDCFSQTTAEFLKVGNEQFGRKEYDKAIASYSDCIRSNPKEAYCYGNRSAAFLQKSKAMPRSERKYVKYQSAEILETSLKALEDANNAVKLDTKNARIFITRGLIYYLEGFHGEAAADFRQALTLEPNNSLAKSELENAEKSYAATLAGSAAVKRAEARSAKQGAEKTKLLKEAVEFLTKSIELDKTNITFLVKRGDVYQDLKAHDKAVADYSEALKRKPEYLNDVDLITALVHRAEVYNEQKKMGLALADLEKVLAIPAESPTAFMINYGLHVRAQLYLNAGKMDLAISDLDKVVSNLKTDPEAYFHRGQAHLKNKNKRLAMEDFRTALKLEPAYQQARAALQKLGVQP